MSKGEIVVFALEDRANVEQRRKDPGLTPHSKFLGYFQQGDAKAKVVFEDD